MAAGSLLVGVFLLIGLPTAKSEFSDYCFPGMKCFPDFETFVKLASELDGGLTESIVYTLSPNYVNVTIMKNLLCTRFPPYIVMARSKEDVQKAMLFARKYNLKVAILSSGHDFICRSTGDGAFVINLSLMKGLDVDLNSPLHSDGVIRAESGNSWARVYQELDKHDRVVVGGSAHTVSMGGYTLGGGHSPLSRSLGLAVDNLLEVTMVTVDGAIVNVSSSGTVSVSADGKVTRSSDPGLFWALRGGGGGTFGVVTTFVYKLHKPPSSFGHLTCQFRYSIHTERDSARDFIQFYFDLMKTLPNEWGGYFLSSFDLTYPYDHAIFTVSMLHYGPSSSSSFATIQPLIDYHPEKQQLKCLKQEYAKFWDYEQGAKDATYIRTTLISSFLRSSDFGTGMANWHRNFVMSPPTNTSLPGCTNTLLGGKVSAVNESETAVSHFFRSALGSLSCALVWDNNPTLDHQNMDASILEDKRLRNRGFGVYINEPPAIMYAWRRDLFGNNYGKLLKVKKHWDPTNFLTCLYCVGSDLGRDYSIDPHGQHVPIIG